MPVHLSRRHLLGAGGLVALAALVRGGQSLAQAFEPPIRMVSAGGRFSWWATANSPWSAGYVPLLGEVMVSRSSLSADGREADPVLIGYRLLEPAAVSLWYLGPLALPPDSLSVLPPMSPDIIARQLREEVELPAGEHVFTFDGTESGREPGVKRAVMGDGYYHLLIGIRRHGQTDGSGPILSDGRFTANQNAVASAGFVPIGGGVAVEITHADRDAPRIERLDVSPSRISPNDPDLSDTTTISYDLTKSATVSIWAEGPDGVRRAVMAPIRQAAGSQSFRWSISPIERRTPEGDYRLSIEACDAAGNVGAVPGALTLLGTERPSAAITDVAFEPKRLAAGEPVRVRITIKNTGRVPLRTEGPPPGYRYTTLDTFASVEGGRYRPHPRYWSVGVDWAGGLGPEGARYPYRWSLGRDLQPGEEATVAGEIRILEHWDRIWLYAGLIQEGVSYYIDKFGQQQLDIAQSFHAE